ncbi:hypothetical protein NQZ68_003565 [Dissostichus eleginoides]|nr:hypothetical protein NQZ68_003565 [Dissostichus eleginoides]
MGGIVVRKFVQQGKIQQPAFVLNTGALHLEKRQTRRSDHAVVWALFKRSPAVAETKPDNCWLEISGSGRQVAPAGLHVIKGGEAGESVPGQSGCDRSAASPLWPDTSDRWLTAGDAQTALGMKEDAITAQTVLDGVGSPLVPHHWDFCFNS